MRKINLLLLLIPFLGISQYTDVINSNRPGKSVSAFSVGKNVVQGELGIFMDRQNHDRLKTESNHLGTDFVIRYGFLFEQLEFFIEGTYLSDKTTYTSVTPNVEIKRSNFTRTIVGAKYLIYDPFKNEENNKPNLYSWKANHGFKWKNLIPAVSIYAGANLTVGENDFYPNEPVASPKVMIATQSHLAPKWVLVGNIAYDRFTTDYPELSYILTLTHALKNPKWTVFLENQGIKSDRYADALLTGGAAYLFSKKFQVDASIGGNFKNTPTRLFASIGVSYRLDFHKDEMTRTDKASDKDIKKAQKKSKKKNKKRKSKN